MGDVEIRHGRRISLVSELNDHFSKIKEIIPRIGLREFVVDTRDVYNRATLLRQADGLRAANFLVRGDLGHQAVGYCRPAFDEFLWVSYLGTVDSGLANELLMKLSAFEGLETLRAQHDFLGEPVMTQLQEVGNSYNGLACKGNGS
jgi:hypothetical protein